MSRDEIFDNRKNKYLRIGRNKGFISDLNELSSLDLSENKFNQFIKSKNDLILDNESNNNFLDSLNKTLDRKPILIKLAQQGHCLNNLNLYEILLNTLND